MRHPLLSTVGAALLALWTTGATAGEASEAAPGHADTRQYTFAWPFTEDSEMRPRGGTTTGVPVTLAQPPSPAWQRLTSEALSGFERDRQAILAMAGAYRTTFDFIETLGFTPDYQPARPYQSWGTEYVYVVADERDFISLQHILVMTFAAEDGAPSEPVVVKHWRQDWRYEDRDLHVYTGNATWERRRLSAKEAAGTWSQAVFQVDDSPRYEAVGAWQHRGNHSTWTSGNTWRPLPRREFSVRDDYDVLSGTNRVTIVPTGWVHEEDNLKLVLNQAGEPAEDVPYLAREAGVNRYEHIVGYDFSAGDAYWRDTAPFWEQVRLAWEDLFERHDRIQLEEQVDGERLFEVMFAMADEHADAPPEQARARIDTVLEQFLR